MAADGAAGTTEQQFKDVLKLPASKSQTLQGYQNLIDKLNVIIKLQYIVIFVQCISFTEYKFSKLNKI